VMTHFDEKQCTVDVLRVQSCPADLGMEDEALQHDVVDATMEPERKGSGAVGLSFVGIGD
jgi:hypothetical protein